jgi:hypothetical protein
MRRNVAAAGAVLALAPSAAHAATVGPAGVKPVHHHHRAPVSPVLAAIALCESGGDPTAVSADGTYRGKYQFDYGTWASVGGSGDPAAAPEAEQDRRAQLLYDRAGASPWPVCGA